MSLKWSWLKIVPLWIAIMSGSLSVFREAYGIFVAQPVDSKSIFWQCAWIAFVVSAAIAWWQEHHALTVERSKNQRPEVSVTIEGGSLEPSTKSQTGYRGPENRAVNEFWVCITLFTFFANARPCQTTVDRCSLRIRTPLRTLQAIHLPEGTLPGHVLLELTKPRHLSEMEPNVLLSQGIGVTRFVQFAAEIWEEELAGADLLFTVVDSFHGQWEATARLADLERIGEMPDF